MFVMLLVIGNGSTLGDTQNNQFILLGTEEMQMMIDMR